MARYLAGWIDLWLRHAAILGLSSLIGLAAVCAIVVHFLEGWDWIDAVYFAVVSLATVGYGDFVPNNNVTKIFVIFYLPVGITLWFIALGAVGAKLFDMQRQALERARDAAMRIQSQQKSA